MSATSAFPGRSLKSAAGEEISLMVKWFEEAGYAADVSALRSAHPDLINIEKFLSSLDW